MDQTRNRAPFWVVDVVAIIGIILFVVTGKLDPGWGLGAFFVILGYAQPARALTAAAGNSMPPPGVSSGGAATVALSLFALFFGRGA